MKSLTLNIKLAILVLIGLLCQSKLKAQEILYSFKI